jgi:hypothetical protein
MVTNMQITRSPVVAGFSAALMMIVALGVLGPVAQATTAAAEDYALFASPYPLNRVASDPYGDAMWFGTENGAFQVSPDPLAIDHFSVHNGLPAYMVNDVAPGPNEVWFATNMGTSVLARSTGSFEALKNVDGSRFSSSTRTIRFFGQEAWVNTDFDGLFRVSLQTKVAVPVPNPVNGSSFKHPVYDTWIDGDQAYISVTGYGLVVWNMATGSAQVVKKNLFNQSPMYYRLLVTPSAVFVGTVGDGLIEYDRKTGSLWEHDGPGTTNSPSIGGMVRLGAEIWMSTISGVTRYDVRTTSWKNWQNLPGGGSPDIAVFRGQVYATTRGGNLARYDRATDAWAQPDWWISTKAPRYNGILGCTWDQDRFLFGTAGGGANYFDPVSYRWTSAGQEEGDRGHPSDIFVWHTATDRWERWFASAHGLTVQNRTTGVWTNYRPDGRDPSYAGNDNLHTMDVELTPTDVWAATISTKPTPSTKSSAIHNTWEPGNLARMNRATGQWTYFNRADGLGDENVTAAQPDGDKVWVGTLNRGLHLLRTADNSIRHVFPTDGRLATVHAIFPQGGIVWVGTGDGLVAISSSTLAATNIPAFKGLNVISFALDAAGLWVGTDDGVYLYNPASDSAVRYPRGATAGMIAQCMLIHDGLLYVGTTGGVERFDLTNRLWLSQVLHRGTSDSQKIRSQPKNIQIGSPSSGTQLRPGEPVDVRGTAQGPAGSVVEVRSRGGQWRQATGVSSWSVSVPVGSEAPGASSITARLRYEAQTLAQASITTEIVWPSGGGQSSASGPRIAFYHAPTLEAIESETLTLEVYGSPNVEGSSGSLELVDPAGTDRSLPLVETAPNTLAATFDAGAPGTIHYSLHLAADGEHLVLPGADEADGGTYTLVVHPASTSVSLTARGSEWPVAARGTSIVNVSVANSLTRGTDLHLTFGGTAGAWIKPVESIHLEPNQPSVVSLYVTPPKGKTVCKVDVTIKGTVEGYPAVQPTMSARLNVGAAKAVVAPAALSAAQADHSQNHPTSGVGSSAALATLALAGMVGGRRRRT